MMTRENLTVMATIIICGLIAGIRTAGGDAGATGQDSSKGPIREEVLITADCIMMPLGRIVLVRKDSQFCAVKFTEAWAGKTREDQYANYESYYQGDGTGDFASGNVQYRKEQLVDRRMVGIGRLFSFPAGPRNKDIKCGPIRLDWTGEGSIYFYAWGRKEGDYGIQLAPTKWTDISQVKVFEPRLKWYRYDEKRKRAYVPIDKLWGGTE